MPLLDAVLAFAVTMLLVATVVSIVIRAIRSFTKVSSKQLVRRLERFYASEVRAVIDTELARLGARADDAAQEEIRKAARRFVAHMKKHPGLPRPLAEIRAGGTFGNQVVEHGIDGLSTEELIERLRRSGLGNELLEQLGDEAEAVLGRLGRRYEAVGEQLSVAMRQRAQYMATAVALVLGFALNIDSVHILTTYLNDDEARAVVIARGEALFDRYEREARAAAVAREADEADEAEELVERFEAARSELHSLQGSGVPLGWHLFPNCPATSTDARCIEFWENRFLDRALPDVPKRERAEANTIGAKLRDATSAIWRWLIGILLTGALAGLGAPFWYDIASGISRFGQQFRGSSSSAGAGQGDNALLEDDESTD